MPIYTCPLALKINTLAQVIPKTVKKPSSAFGNSQRAEDYIIARILQLRGLMKKVYSFVAY